MGSTRTDVEFTSEGVTIRAWFYRPDGPNPPVIVMAHGLGGVKTMRLDAFAERFCDAGYACVVFDYRHFGDSDGQPRQLLSIPRQLADYEAAIAYARSRDDVDASRVVVWGTSFSGGHALVLASKHPELAAAIAQCPFTSGIASTMAINPLTSAKVTARALSDVVSSVRGRDPVYIDVAGTADSVALMTAPDALSGYDALKKPGVEYPNEVPARIGLAIPFYRPAAKVAAIGIPTLICACDTDTVAPVGPTLRAASSNPNVQVNHYADGHFAIYVGDAFENVIADEVDFLDRVVPL